MANTDKSKYIKMISSKGMIALEKRGYVATLIVQKIFPESKVRFLEKQTEEFMCCEPKFLVNLAYSLGLDISFISNI